MDTFDNIRKQIDDIDEQIAKLFIKRMSLVKNIAKIKKDSCIEIHDTKREKLIKENIKRIFSDKSLFSYYEDVLDSILGASCRYQRDLITND